MVPKSITRSHNVFKMTSLEQVQTLVLYSREYSIGKKMAYKSINK